jgi:hypothetical protein
MLIGFGAATSTEESQYSQPVLYAACAKPQPVLCGLRKNPKTGHVEGTYGFDPSGGKYENGHHLDKRLQVVQLLLENGADVSRCDWSRSGIMIWEIAIESYDTGLLRLLLDAVALAGKSIPVSHSKNTIMHYVASLNLDFSADNADITMLEMLRRHANKTQNHTLDISTQNRGGHTTLFFAAQSGKIETVRYLLDNGIDPPTEDSFDDLFDVSTDDIWDIIVEEFDQREKRNIAFAMASHSRIGALSTVHSFPLEMSHIISKMNGRHTTWNNQYN